VRIIQSRWESNNPWMINYAKAKTRCTNKKTKIYSRYGAKGILFLMTKEQFKFLWMLDNAGAMSHPSIDRVDSKGNYEFSNCRFLEKSENSRLGAGVLTHDDVRRIRKDYKYGDGSKLGKKYGVGKTAITNAVRGKTWGSR